ncbi:hypothetical protein FGO68_gene5680 [Halteria grandinella]|uniref:Uncharacterized protein n=1 Tax=Halteria grandinella TaxID=5974 RepID=A0A8J8P3U4_HALGN|nr:hypothetical protein FGO68_gene5680 [Halteria grandinella]
MTITLNFSLKCFLWFELIILSTKQENYLLRPIGGIVELFYYHHIYLIKYLTNIYDKLAALANQFTCMQPKLLIQTQILNFHQNLQRFFKEL